MKTQVSTDLISGQTFLLHNGEWEPFNPSDGWDWIALRRKGANLKEVGDCLSTFGKTVPPMWNLWIYKGSTWELVRISDEPLTSKVLYPYDKPTLKTFGLPGEKPPEADLTAEIALWQQAKEQSEKDAIDREKKRKEEKAQIDKALTSLIGGKVIAFNGESLVVETKDGQQLQIATSCWLDDYDQPESSFSYRIIGENK